VRIRARAVVRQFPGPDDFLLKLDLRESPVGLRRHLHHIALQCATAIPGGVVEDDFQSVLGNWEGCGLVVVLQAVSTFNQFDGGSVFLCLVHDGLGHGCRPARLVDRYEVIVVGLDHPDLTGRQLVLVLIHIALVNAEEFAVVLEGVNVSVIPCVTIGCRRQATVPGWNLITVACLLGAHRGQFIAEVRGFLFGYRSQCAARAQ